MLADPLLTVGQVAERAGLSTAAVRYYEDLGLVGSTRTSGNQRRYARHVLRRLAFVTAARRVGLPLAQIKTSLDTLPADRAPSPEDWQRLSGPWAEHIAGRIRELQVLQDTLQECLGCGCLSLTRCALYNPGDEATAGGAGSRWLRQAQEQAGSATATGPTVQPPAVDSEVGSGSSRTCPGGAS